MLIEAFGFLAFLECLLAAVLGEEEDVLGHAQLFEQEQPSHSEKRLLLRGWVPMGLCLCLSLAPFPLWARNPGTMATTLSS